MTTIIKFSLVSLMAVSLSCNSAKTAVNDESAVNDTVTETSKQMESQLINEGYSVGTMKYIKNSKCSYIIVDEKTKVNFDPINIDNEKFSSFKSENMKVFYKYRPLRMMNRCNEAQPIELEEMKSN